MDKFLAGTTVTLNSITNLVSQHAGDAHFFDDSITPTKVRGFLDSPDEKEKIKGMKWVLAMISKGKGHAVAELFPAVVKNVANKVRHFYFCVLMFNEMFPNKSVYSCYMLTMNIPRYTAMYVFKPPTTSLSRILLLALHANSQPLHHYSRVSK